MGAAESDMHSVVALLMRAANRCCDGTRSEARPRKLLEKRHNPDKIFIWASRKVSTVPSSSFSVLAG